MAPPNERERERGDLQQFANYTRDVLVEVRDRLESTNDTQVKVREIYEKLFNEETGLFPKLFDTETGLFVRVRDIKARNDKIDGYIRIVTNSIIGAVVAFVIAAALYLVHQGVKP